MSAEAARCFVALEPAESARAALGRTVERARRIGADVRWLRPAAMHLTLKFLGDVERPRLGELIGALEGVRMPSPLSLRLAGVGRFPPRGRPRVFWVGLTGDVDELGELARRVDLACASLGFPAEVRPYRAHITLGRVKGPRGLDELEERLSRSDLSEPFGIFDELTLFESELAKDGARYTERARVKFAVT